MAPLASYLIPTTAQDTQALKQVWKNLDSKSCPSEYNFHLHTIHSDGRLQPEDVVEQAVAIGLKGLAITDHHTIEGFQRAVIYLQKLQRELPDTKLPHLWTGIEITSKLLNIEVHILGYGFEIDHPAMKVYKEGERPSSDYGNADLVISAIQEAGGLAVLAHPARYRLPTDVVIAAVVEEGIDGVEAYYAYGNPHPWQPSPVETEQVKQLSQEYGLHTTCGTDTHGLNLLVRI